MCNYDDRLHSYMLLSFISCHVENENERTYLNSNLLVKTKVENTASWKQADLQKNKYYERWTESRTKQLTVTAALFNYR